MSHTNHFDKLIMKTKAILKKVLRFQQQNQATFNCTLWCTCSAINISQVTMKCFSFDVIVFAMLPAHGI